VTNAEDKEHLQKQANRRLGEWAVRYKVNKRTIAFQALKEALSQEVENIYDFLDHKS